MLYEIQLKPFALEHAETVFQLLQSVSPFFPRIETLDEHCRAFIQQEGCYACVAMYNSCVVGFGSLFVLKRVRGGSSAIIEDLVVCPVFRRQGIGRLILQDLLAAAKAENCFKVSLESSNAAQHFYQSIGFQSGSICMKIFL